MIFGRTLSFGTAILLRSVALVIVASGPAGDFAQAQVCHDAFQGRASLFKASRIRSPSELLAEKVSNESSAVRRLLNWAQETELQTVRQTREDKQVELRKLDGDYRALIDDLFHIGVLVESPVSLALDQDKFITYQFMRAVLQPEVLERWFPRTFGIAQLALERGFLNSEGKVRFDLETFSEEIRSLFPDGLVVKPTLSSRGRESGQFYEGEEAIQFFYQILRLYGRTKAWSAGGSISHGGFWIDISGELFVIQDRLNGFHPNRFGTSEFRVHTIEDRVVKGATFHRWRKWIFSSTTVQDIERQVQEFIQELPTGLVQGTLFAIDVMRGPDGKVRIVEMNPNVEGLAYTGFLKYPKAQAALLRHLRHHYKVEYGIDRWAWIQRSLRDLSEEIKSDLQVLRSSSTGTQN